MKAVMKANSSPLVSVVIPTYNRAHLLQRTIASVLAQTYPALEIVIVDDGSTDDTSALVRRASAEDARIRYVHKSNGGPASARNVGFRESRGEYVALLDSDDTWSPWKLALQIRCMEAHRDVGMTWTDMEMIDPEGRVADPAHLRTMFHAYRLFPLSEIFPRTYPLADLAPELADVVGDAKLRIGDVYSKMIMGSLVATPTVVLRRERLERVGGFDETLTGSGEDYDFHLRTAREGPVALLDLPALRYQQGFADRLTAKRYQLRMAENALRTLESAIARDREAIDLPEAMIRRRFAKSHAWIAYERLERGESALARSHYLESLRQWPFQPALAKPFLFSLVPFGAGPVLRDRLRAWRASRNPSRPAEGP